MLSCARGRSKTRALGGSVGGLTNLVEEQKNEPGLLTINLVRFDGEVEVVHRMAGPEGVTIELEPRGSTALYDSIGIGINTLATDIDALPEHDKSATVHVIVVTDGGPVHVLVTV